MKLVFAALACAILLHLAGCASLHKIGCKYSMHNHDEFGIMENDIRNVHEFGRMTECNEKEITLTGQQKRELEKYHIDGHDPVKYIEVTAIDTVPIGKGRQIEYVRVARKRSIGKVFVVTGAGEFGDYRLLVCMHENGLINEIYIKDNPQNVINGEFIDQFIGRSLDRSFDLRETPNDYLVTPMKLAAIKDAPVISKDIALKLRGLVAVAKVALR